MSDAIPEPGLAETFAQILGGLRLLIAKRMHRPTTVRGRDAHALLWLLWTRLGRMTARFNALVARVEAGTLPPPRPTDPTTTGQPRPPRPPRPPGPRIPGSFAWLVILMPNEAACYGSALRYLLARPEMQALLAAHPPAARMFRPLCRMLATPDADMWLPPRPVATKRQAAPQPVAPKAAASPEAMPHGPAPSADPDPAGTPRDRRPRTRRPAWMRAAPARIRV